LSEGRHTVLADAIHQRLPSSGSMSIDSSKSQSSSSSRRLAT
jgi:hypothetical protein